MAPGKGRSKFEGLSLEVAQFVYLLRSNSSIREFKCRSTSTMTSAALCAQAMHHTGPCLATRSVGVRVRGRPRQTHSRSIANSLPYSRTLGRHTIHRIHKTRRGNVGIHDTRDAYGARLHDAYRPHRRGAPLHDVHPHLWPA
jgi:hypothetical protein